MSVAAAWLPKVIPRLRPRPQVDTDEVIAAAAAARALTDRRAEELRLAMAAALNTVDHRAEVGLQ